MNDASQVQAGSAATSSFAAPNTTTQMTSALNAVNPSTTILAASSSVQNLGGGQQADLDSGSWVPQIVSPTLVQMDRGSSQDRFSQVDYFAVQFVAQ